jgi:excisionase family DNA binding protein
MADALLTTEEVAALLEVTPRTVRRWLDSGRIHVAKRVGQAYLVSASEVARLIRQPRPRLGRPPMIRTQRDELPLGQAS